LIAAPHDGGLALDLVGAELARDSDLSVTTGPAVARVIMPPPYCFDPRP
jgi:hypothetical protein